MSSSPSETLRRKRSDALDEARARSVSFKNGSLIVELVDGRSVSVPLEWFPRLVEASATERKRWELDADGAAIWWPDLDDGIEITHLLLGWKSGEGKASFKRWLEARKARKAS
jgi:hypothetical protein